MPQVQSAMALCEQMGHLLYEVYPDIMPYGKMSNLELALWERYYSYKESVRQRHKV